MSNGARRRGSIFTGLLLILIGVLFLLDRFDPSFGIGHLIRVYWPVLIILWGVAKLVDHFSAQRAGEPRAPLLSGGEAALMILLAFVLAGFVFRDWIREHAADLDIEIPPFHQSYSQTRQIAPKTLPAGAHIKIETERGDISIHSVEGSELRVNLKQTAWGPSESAADAQMRSVDVVIEESGNDYHIHPVRRFGFRALTSTDLDVALPKAVSLDVSTGHGDVAIAGISGGVVAHSANGDIQIHDVGSDVSIGSQHGDVKVSGVDGNVKLTGRGDDVDISNVSGDAAIEGAFVGSVRIANIAKSTRCVSPWADLTVDHLTGRLDADSSDIALTGADGAAKLIAHNKDIDVKNVAGKIEIFNTHGDVKVAYKAPPREDLIVKNESGDTDVTLPARSSFGVSAVSRSGEVQSDFQSVSLKTLNEETQGQISGQFGGAGPMLSITTSYGTVHLRKAG
ncbi:MAG TPA: DUF4097 family beta strand repeat-containing protein [Candidatus Acidoferrales bacterium]|nr:DUF4097 family beta strand repeat-containing protein [Candidatus Acidoferrales bacterium]